MVERVYPLLELQIKSKILAHALNHCESFMGMMWNQLGEILKQIRKAISFNLGEMFLEQEIPEDSGKNCPNLVVINRSLEKAIVVDVTILFEGEENSLQAVRSTKETKYSALKAWLQTQYKEVELAAICH